MIRPIGIEDPDLCHGRIPVLLLAKIFLNEKEILEGHGQTQRIIKSAKISLGHIGKAIQYSHISGIRMGQLQGDRLFHAALTGIYRVNAISLDLL